MSFSTISFSKPVDSVSSPALATTPADLAAPATNTEGLTSEPPVLVRCTTCGRPNDNTQYKLCDACRKKSRERSREIAARKREKMERMLQAEKEASSVDAHKPKGENEKPGKEEKAKAVKTKKRVREASPDRPRKKPSAPSRTVDPDEYQFLADGIAALAEARKRSPARLDFRFTFAVVAADDVTHQRRISMVVNALREQAGLMFSLNSKLQEPGSSSYARHNAITERYRCKCMRATTSAVLDASTGTSSGTSSKSASPLKRTQSLLSQWVSKQTNDGASEVAQPKEERCGGYIYVSSEWDTRSHSAGIKGQRVTISVIHPDATKA